VAGDVVEPTLLFTYLGLIHSRAGREFEQVCAVLVRRPDVTEFISGSERWLSLANPAGGINTRDLWKNQFSSWAGNAEAAALAAAGKGFRPIATDVLNRRRIELRRDQERLQEWLGSRAREIIGDRGQLAVALELPGIGARAEAQPATAAWARLESSLERLAGFANDNSQPVASRHEAQTVITLFRKRLDDLDAREAVREPEVVPLGMLMIVPQTRRVDGGEK
jgi:hypothetical protein